MTDVLREAIAIPLCAKCHSKHFPHETCKKTGEDTVKLCSLCVGDHGTADCPVLDPGKSWEQPAAPVAQEKQGRLRRRRRRGRRR